MPAQHTRARLSAACPPSVIMEEEEDGRWRLIKTRTQLRRRVGNLNFFLAQLSQRVDSTFPLVPADRGLSDPRGRANLDVV